MKIKTVFLFFTLMFFYGCSEEDYFLDNTSNEGNKELLTDFSDDVAILDDVVVLNDGIINKTNSSGVTLTSISGPTEGVYGPYEYNYYQAIHASTSASVTYEWVLSPSNANANLAYSFNEIRIEFTNYGAYTLMCTAITANGRSNTLYKRINVWTPVPGN
jgi:hypothetical protein